MPSLDKKFWMDLVKAQILDQEIRKILQYTDNAGVPLDLNYPKGPREISAFKHFATSLEDKALELSEIAERITTYTAEMEEILSEKENELLPDEGNPLEPIGA